MVLTVVATTRRTDVALTFRASCPRIVQRRSVTCAQGGQQCRRNSTTQRAADNPAGSGRYFTMPPNQVVTGLTRAVERQGGVLTLVSTPGVAGAPLCAYGGAMEEAMAELRHAA